MLAKPEMLAPGVGVGVPLCQPKRRPDGSPRVFVCEPKVGACAM